MSVAPKDDRGRFMSKKCPECGDDLVFAPDKMLGNLWHCTGLIDPENDRLPLEPCPYVHVDGDKP